METRLLELLREYFPEAEHIEVSGFEPIPGGYSRETFRFDAVVRSSVGEEHHPLILRKDPPAATAILHTSREIEHDLIEALRLHTDIPIGRSLGHERDPERFGEPAMVIQRMHGNSQTSDLFHDGPDTHQADDVMRHLCEVLVELHGVDISTIDPHGRLADPRGTLGDAMQQTMIDLDELQRDGNTHADAGLELIREHMGPRIMRDVQTFLVGDALLGRG